MDTQENHRTTSARTPSGPGTVHAVVRRSYGGAEQVLVDTVPAPRPGRGQVLLRVAAGGVDRGQVHMLTGTPTLMRLGTGLSRPRRAGLGLEVAGVVEEVGPGVTTLAVGDFVFGTATAALAETAVARAGKLAAVPEGLTLTDAAALPVSGSTALQALRDQARVRPGDRVLVVGASGGVGVHAVQLAAAMGCDVVGVCSAAKADLVRSLGASDVVTYETQEIPQDASFDVVLDVGGRRPAATLRRALTPTGTLVLVGGEDGGRVLGGLDRQVAAVLRGLAGRQRVRMFVSTTRAADLTELAGYVSRGELRPVVERTFALDDAAAAFAHVHDGRVRGKVVVRVGAEV